MADIDDAIKSAGELIVQRRRQLELVEVMRTSIDAEVKKLKAHRDMLIVIRDIKN